MATYAEIEDLRDWAIDTLGETLARFDALNGEEPANVIEDIRQQLSQIESHGSRVVGLLDLLLIAKKRAEAPPPLLSE
jgi:hypothetical protein